MSEPRILLCAPALTADESASGLEMLRALSLPGATKVLVTTGKFDTEKEAQAFNIEAGYPGETAHLQTLSRWAEVTEWPDARFRDGYDLFCLQRILSQREGFDIAVLLRDGFDFESRRSNLSDDLNGRMFLTREMSEGGGNLLINLADPRANRFLNRAVHFYLTGRAYALEPYDFDRALTIAAETVELEAGFDDLGPDTVGPADDSALADVEQAVSE